MRSITSIILALIVCTSMYGQELYYECNINTLNKELKQTDIVTLDESCGYVIIPKRLLNGSGSNGMIIFHDNFREDYAAYELTCPVCKDDGIVSLIKMKTVLLPECDRCHTQWQNLCNGAPCPTNNSDSNGDHWLRYYHTYKIGNKLIISSKRISKYED